MRMEIQFIDREITSWGGISILKKMIDQSGYVIFGSLYRWLFNNLKFDSFTFDIDSSIMTRYGEQEGSAQGYNRYKPGRKSQHPLLAFVADIEITEFEYQAQGWEKPRRMIAVRQKINTRLNATGKQLSLSLKMTLR